MDGSGYYLDLWRYRKMYFLIPALLVAVIAAARMGKFSSDRAIREYCEQIWRVEPL
jgi:dihydrodipicolinate synthase/N-acetylneuraminate lyase